MKMCENCMHKEVCKNKETMVYSEKCSHYKSVALSNAINYHAMFKREMEERVAMYGYSKQMTPKKNTVCNAIRTTVKVLTGLNFVTPRFDEKDYALAMNTLNHVLPKKVGNDQ